MTLLSLVLVKLCSVVTTDRDDAMPTVGQVNRLVPVWLSTLVQILGAVTGTLLRAVSWVELCEVYGKFVVA